MKNFPYEYYYYGSQDSTDEDVVISIPKEDMPLIQEDRKRFIKSIEVKYNLPWNATLVVIEDGVIVDTIYPKSWVDSLNNAIFNTYSYHLDKQVYPNPIKRELKRNKLLAVYKCVRTVCAMLTKTHYRTQIKPIIKGCHPFKYKINFLKTINFNTIESFNQNNMSDVDVWKVLAFYMGQNISLIQNNIEIYTKSDLIKEHNILSNFINRNVLNSDDINKLNYTLIYWLDILNKYGYLDAISNNNILEFNNEKIDMKNETNL